MGELTQIGWTEATWNPWYGCTKISPGCKFCYMYRDMKKYGRDPFTVQRSKTKFDEPLKWKEPRMVFTCSWSDFFIEAADEWRPEAWTVIYQTPHVYQILTKRPERITVNLPVYWDAIEYKCWLGTSIESPEYLGRADKLRAVPARTRFLSLEPLLESMPRMDLSGIDWVIVGGESGSAAERRECDPAWICNVVDQCRAAKVPVFVKQDSGAKPGQQGRIPNEYWIHEFPHVS